MKSKIKIDKVHGCPDADAPAVLEDLLNRMYKGNMTTGRSGCLAFLLSHCGQAHLEGKTDDELASMAMSYLVADSGIADNIDDDEFDCLSDAIKDVVAPSDKAYYIDARII